MKLRSGLHARLVMVVLAGFVLAPCAAGTLLGPIATAQTLHDRMRMIYEDQILWTRMVALGVFDDLKGSEAYTNRLLDNHEAFEKVLAPYYKDGAGKLGLLLEEHVVLTEKVFEGLRAGDTLDSMQWSWYANADEIATLMNSLNPDYWPAGESKLLWRRYLDATLEGAIAHQKGEWLADVAAHDALHLHTLKMADFMSDGMIRQFPFPK